MSRRLQEIVDGTARLGPETVHIDVTNGCNTNCITCWDHSPLLAVARSASWKRKRVDPAEVETLLDDLVALGGLRNIILSGMGEPFTHPAIYAMIEAASLAPWMPMSSASTPSSMTRLSSAGMRLVMIVRCRPRRFTAAMSR